MKNNSVLSATLQARLQKYNNKPELIESGKVISINDGICIVSGLKNVELNELVQFDDKTLGFVLSLSTDTVNVVLLGKYEHIVEGCIVKRLHDTLSIGVSEKLIGRVIDPTGKVLDGGNEIKYQKTNKINVVAPGILQRKDVNQPLETGTLVIDALFPIGKGQRELILGDRQTGKTTIATNAIMNQKGKDVICIYVAIGQKNFEVASIINNFKKNETLNYSIVLVAGASDEPGLKYIAPYSGMALAEYFSNQGKDVLIVFDDLTKHADAYRTITLLLNKPVGREAFPGDVFYLHSKLLERSGSFDKSIGGGTITALPIVETKQDDVSAYIPTNIISITDGQLFMRSNLYNSGQLPAIDTDISVSRLGGSVQTKEIKSVSKSIKIKLSIYNELQSFNKFSIDVDKHTREQLALGKNIMESFKQDKHTLYSQHDEYIILCMINSGLIRFIPILKISEFIENILSKKYFDKVIDNYDELVDNLKKKVIEFVKTIKDYNDEDMKELEVFK